MIRRRSKARRGKIVDRAYLDWIHTQPCLVQGIGCRGMITAHHVCWITRPDGVRERVGKNDRRTLPLCEAHHLHGAGPHAIHRLTGDQFRDWERHFEVDIERAIEAYNACFPQ